MYKLRKWLSYAGIMLFGFYLVHLLLGHQALSMIQINKLSVQYIHNHNIALKLPKSPMILNKVNGVLELPEISELKKQNNDSAPEMPKVSTFWLRNVSGGLLVDRWEEICTNERFELKNAVWHPLFPRIPEGSFVMSKINTLNPSSFHRIYGYLLSNNAPSYDFQFWTKGKIEIIFMDTGLATNHISNGFYSFKQFTLVFHEKLSSVNNTLTSSERRSVDLKPNWIYYVEILSIGNFDLKWRQSGKPTFINIENFYHTNKLKLHKKASFFKEQIYKMKPKYEFGNEELARLAFNDRPILQPESLIEKSEYKCSPTPNRKVKIKKLYDGYMIHLRYLFVVTSPKEHFEHTENYTSLNPTEATEISGKVFDKLTRLYQNTTSLSFQNLVHVQSNYDKDFQKFKNNQDTYYFIELDVKDSDDGRIFRTSHFVKPLPSGDICFMTDYKWKPGVEINLLTPLKDQKVWFLYTIEMLEELIAATNEVNVKWIVIDYSSNRDHETRLKASKLNYTYFNMALQQTPTNKNKKKAAVKKFSKVKALNYGIDHVANSDSIVFVLDLHLQLPRNIFDRIRKLTIKGKTAFTPSLMRQECGEHEQFTKLVDSYWVDNGPGMIGMYKSDFKKIGGYNERLFANKWGGEDWELLDRILGNGIYIIKQRMQRFYHIYHSRKSMWKDG